MIGGVLGPLKGLLLIISGFCHPGYLHGGFLDLTGAVGVCGETGEKRVGHIDRGMADSRGQELWQSVALQQVLARGLLD